MYILGSVFFFYFLEGLPVNNPFWCPWYLLRKKIISFYQTQHFWSYVRCVKKRSPPKFDDIQNIAFLTLLCSFKKRLEIWSTSCTAFLFQVLLPYALLRSCSASNATLVDKGIWISNFCCLYFINVCEICTHNRIQKWKHKRIWNKQSNSSNLHCCMIWLEIL